MLAIMGSEQSTLRCSHLARPVCTCFGSSVDSPPSERSRLRSSSCSDEIKSSQKCHDASVPTSESNKTLQTDSGCHNSQISNSNNSLHKIPAIDGLNEVTRPPKSNGYILLKNGLTCHNNSSELQKSFENELSKEDLSDKVDSINQDVCKKIKSDLNDNNNQSNISQEQFSIKSNSNEDQIRISPESSKENSQTDSKTVDKVQLNEKVSTSDPSQHNGQPKSCEDFRELVVNEENRLKKLISVWNSLISDETNNCPSEICDEIRSVVGQTKLVIAERFPQFSTLIDRADNKLSSDLPPVLLSDLQGFWEMIYFQVEDVTKKFQTLEELRQNEWKVQSSLTQKTQTTGRRNVNKNSKANTSSSKKVQSKEDKRRKEAARKRLAEARKALAMKNQQQSSEVFGSNLDEGNQQIGLVEDDRLNIAKNCATTSRISDVHLEIEQTISNEVPKFQA